MHLYKYIVILYLFPAFDFALQLQRKVQGPAVCQLCKCIKGLLALLRISGHVSLDYADLGSPVITWATAGSRLFMIMCMMAAAARVRHGY